MINIKKRAHKISSNFKDVSVNYLCDQVSTLRKMSI